MIILKIVILLSLVSVSVPEADAFTLGASNNGSFKGWNRETLTFLVNYTDCSVSNAALNTAIDAAVDLWNSVPTSGIKLARGGESTATVAQLFASVDTQVPVIACSSDFSTDTGGSNPDNFAALGVFSIGSDSHISYGFVALNSTTSSTQDISGLDATTLSIVLAHEMGHVLGLGHSGDASALMYFSTGNKTALKLSQDDIAGLTFLNPRNEPSDGVLGCGSLSTPGGGGAPPLLSDARFYHWMGLFLLFFLVPLEMKRRIRVGALSRT